MNAGADAGGEPGIDFAELHAGFAKRNALYVAHRGIRSEQKVQLRFQRNFEGVIAKGTLPAINVSVLRRQHDIAAFRERGSFGYRDGLCGACCNTLARETVRRRESPCAVRQDSDAKADGFGLGKRPNLTVLGRKVALPDVHHAHIGIRSAAQLRRIDCVRGEIPHDHSPE